MSTWTFEAILILSENSGSWNINTVNAAIRRDTELEDDDAADTGDEYDISDNETEF